MPRTARACVGGMCYHVMNRGNARERVFHDRADYLAFLRAAEDACSTVAMRLLAFCLMPNHFHLVVWPREGEDLSIWMHRLLNAHVQRHRCRHATSGHIWQGRFKAFPIKDDAHLLTVLRYVERNPVRANLASRAEDWPWSSTRFWTRQERPEFLHDGPIDRPRDWLNFVNGDEARDELNALRNSVRRGVPYGDARWAERTAMRLGLESTLRERGRPRNSTMID